MSNQCIIGVSGKKQSGKNTICDTLQSIICESGYDHKDCRLYSFADALKKKVCIDTLGLSYEQCYGTDEQKNTPTMYKWESLPKEIRHNNRIGERRASNGEICEFIYPSGDMTAREIMQIVGTDIFRKYFDDKIWVNATFRSIKKDGCKFALISDVRFPSEVESIIQEGGFIVRLMRDNGSGDFHSSETALDDYDFSHKNCIVFDNRDMNIKQQEESIISIFRDRLLMS